MEHYLVAMAITAGIYGLMALGTNVIWGMAGMVNLGIVGFVGVGAYVSALLTLKLGWPIAAGMAAGALAAALVGVLVGAITVNLRADYLAIVTLGFAESVRIVTSNEIWLANGTDGLSGIPGPWRSELGPHAFNLFYLGIVVAVVAVAFFLVERLCHSPFGRVLRAIRDDEQVASVAGKFVLAFKLKAFAIGTGALGLAGALYAHFTSYIAPDVFVPLLTLYIKLSLLAGGLGNNRGAIAGAIAVVFFLEFDPLHRAAHPVAQPCSGRGAARAADQRIAARDPALPRERLDPGADRAPAAAVRSGRAHRHPSQNRSHDMSGTQRSLTLGDVANVMRLSADAADACEVYARVDILVRETVGYKLLTVLRFVEETQEVERLYSSDPKAYPVGGRKQLATINKDHSLAASGQIFIAANPDEVKRTFPDHELIFSLGAGAVLNAPIRHLGRRLGTLNCCGAANSYGEKQIEAARILADLLAPTLLGVSDG